MPSLKPVDVTVDSKGMPIPSADPNVQVPALVTAAAQAAEVLHAQAYAPQPVAPAPAPVPAPAPPGTQPQTPPAPAAPVTAAVTEPEGDRSTWDANKWMQHAKSMEGR